MNAYNLHTGIEVNFHVFVRASEDEVATYVRRGVARGGPGEIMDLVKERAEGMAGVIQGTKTNSDVSVTRVYKVQFPKNRLWCTSLTTAAESINHGGTPARFRIQGGNAEVVHCGRLRGNSR